MTVLWRGKKRDGFAESRTGLHAIFRVYAATDTDMESGKTAAVVCNVC
jgi:hypothetical protein